jgi:hypothetical protein
VKAALSEYQRAGYQPGITAQFALLCPVLLLRNEPEAALEVIDHGLSIVSHNSERFLEAELYRLKAWALLMRGAPDAGRNPCSTRLCKPPAANTRELSSFGRRPTWPSFG